VPAPKTKIHHVQFVTGSLLSISTEDGRIVFFDTDVPASKGDSESIPALSVMGQISIDGTPSRIKEYAVLPLSSTDQDEDLPRLLVAAGSSDGMVRIWSLKEHELSHSVDDSETVKQVGTLLGEYATGNRITCLVGFIMGPSMGNKEENGHESDGSVNDESSDE
jgi:protein MAK11